MNRQQAFAIAHAKVTVSANSSTWTVSHPLRLENLDGPLFERHFQTHRAAKIFAGIAKTDIALILLGEWTEDRSLHIDLLARNKDIANLKMLYEIAIGI